MVQNPNTSKVQICTDCPDKYDSIRIIFEQPSVILSTSSGYIEEDDRVVIKQKEKFIGLEIYSDLNILKYRIEYLLDNDIIHYKNSEQQVNHVKIRNEKINSKSRIIAKMWSEEDVVLEFNNNYSALLCFGDLSDCLSVTDMIFPIYNLKRVFIPKEIIWKNMNNYTSDQLRCCELFKSNRHSLDILHKVEISNRISLSSLPHPQLRNLSDFILPTGKEFNANKWKINPISVLPVRKND